ncbi:hypothetical protein Tco_0661690 [Tanacetum coccineum]
MSSCKPVPTPLAPHFKLSSHECPKSEEDKEDMSRVPYSSVVGSLMYAMVCTRLDLSHAVSVVSRYMHNPGKMHWEAVKCILRYLKGTSNIGLSFEKRRASPNGVVGYVDSDYEGDLDARKPLSSYIFSHCGSTISWYSSLQAITALSTTEAQYISSTEGVKEAIWLRGMVNELVLPQKVLVVYCDNRSAVHLTKNNKFHSKTKHIELALLVFDTLRGAATTTMKSYGFWFKVEIVGIYINFVSRGKTETDTCLEDSMEPENEPIIGAKDEDEHKRGICFAGTSPVDWLDGNGVEEQKNLKPLKECETSGVTYDLKPLIIDEKLKHKHLMAEIQKF